MPSEHLPTLLVQGFLPQFELLAEALYISRH